MKTASRRTIGMIFEYLFTIPAEVRSFEDPAWSEAKEKGEIGEGEYFLMIHGKVTDVYRILART